MQKRLLRFLVPVLTLLAAQDASATGMGGLPWDSDVTTLQGDLTDPVATGISVIAFLATGAALVFGEELGGIAKKLMYVVQGVAFIFLKIANRVFYAIVARALFN